MTLIEQYEAFDKAFCIELAKYHHLHKDLDKFRGIDLTEEVVAKVNPIIIAIQEKYIELHPCIEWAMQRYQPCAKLRMQYEEFMNHIKEGGAIVADTTKEAQA